MFENPKEIKNQKKKEYVLILLTTVIVPICSVLIICSGKESALYNSLSRLAWPENLLWLIYIWGALNMGNFAFSTKMTLDAGGYTKKWSQAIVGMVIASCLLMIVGISIPSYLDPNPKLVAMRSAHTAISTMGFFGFLIAIIVITFTTIKRNVRQFAILLGNLCFTLVLGVFFLVKVSDPSSYCHVSAPAQILVFGLYNFGMMLSYFTMTLMKKE